MNSTTVNLTTGIQSANENTLYRSFSDSVRFPAGPNSEIVYSPLHRQPHLLPSSSVAFLQGCRNFATIDQHARSMCSQFKIAISELNNVKQQLFSLVSAGLLVSESELIQRISSTSSSSEEAPDKPISVVAIPTKNRTELLRKSLKSYAECSRTFGRSIRFLVSDDSTDDAVIEANREVMRDIKATYGVAVCHVTWREKDAFANALAQETGLAKELLDFAIGHSNEFVDRIGANRNSILLMTVDDVLVQADDDTLCLMTKAPEFKEGLAFSSQNDPTEFWFPQEKELDQLEATFEADDLYAAHESLLGKSVRQICKSSSLPPTVAQTASSFYRKAEAGGKVVVTAPGYAGDSGMGSSIYFLAMQGNNRNRLHASEQHYLNVLRSHKLVRAANTSTVTDGSYCMSMNLGMDNRHLLPPFMPVQRNSDGIFGFMIKATSPDGLLGYIPHLILHHRPAIKATAMLADTTQWSKFARMRFSDLFMALSSSLPQSTHASAEDRMCMIGRSLMDLGSLSPAAFEEHCKMSVLKICSQQIVALNAQLSAYSQSPSYWEKDVRAYTSGLAQYINAPDFAVASDLIETVGIERAKSSTIKALYSYGDLVRNWPTIRSAARALKARGHQPWKSI